MYFIRFMAKVGVCLLVAWTFQSSVASAGSGVHLSCDPIDGQIHYDGENLIYRDRETGDAKELTFRILAQNKIGSRADYCINSEGQEFGAFSTTSLIELRHQSPYGGDETTSHLICRTYSDSYPNMAGVDTKCASTRSVVETLKSFELEQREER